MKNDTNQTQSGDKMVEQIKSELEVEVEDIDQTKAADKAEEGKNEQSGQELSQLPDAEESGQELSQLPDVPTTDPGEHGLPEAKKLKTDHN
ncbi:unnamed protein product [Aureobasidium vineae]|uniref:Uncharacterized protein n=1 Tax=Aureobasidium vineae TaxID=2773715 RepID=A0A9N8PEX0_9PEZI|nr:unnamed protein product [Aureobasidium vineae]